MGSVFIKQFFLLTLGYGFRRISASANNGSSYSAIFTPINGSFYKKIDILFLESIHDYS